jgi:hypothetical protein
LAVGIVAVLLAGCGGKPSGANEVRLGDGQRVSLDLPEEQQPDPEDIRGAVSGIVVDDAIYPVAGAAVRIAALGAAATTDDAGLFVFESLPPGLHAVEASKAGHSPGLGTLNVRSGQVSKVVLMAARLPYQAPYHTTHVLDESRSAREAMEDARFHLVAVEQAPAGMVVESYWEGLPDPPVGDALSYRVVAESNSSSETQGSGPNPLRVEFAADWFPSDEYAIRVQVWPEVVAVPPDALGRTFVTVFYVDPPPAGWSFVEGDA